MDNAELNRHCKVLCVSSDDVLRIFSDWRTADGIQLPVIKDLPSGYAIRSVEYCVRRHCFAFCIVHPDFPEVQAWCEPPVINRMGEIQFWRFTSEEKIAISNLADVISPGATPDGKHAKGVETVWKEIAAQIEFYKAVS